MKDDNKKFTDLPKDCYTEILSFCPKDIGNFSLASKKTFNLSTTAFNIYVKKSTEQIKSKVKKIESKKIKKVTKTPMHCERFETCKNNLENIYKSKYKKNVLKKMKQSIEKLNTIHRKILR